MCDDMSLSRLVQVMAWFQHQVITGTNVDLLWIGSLETNFIIIQRNFNKNSNLFIDENNLKVQCIGHFVQGFRVAKNSENGKRYGSLGM